MTLADPSTIYRLTLACEGPFFVNDWSWEPAAPVEGATDRDPQLRALRETRSEPLLLGTSLMGALRSRAVWLHGRATSRAIAGHGTPPPADVIDRLFGSRDRRGALQVRALKLQPGGQPSTMLATSVALDRFSGAPLEGALYSVDCFVDPVFHAELVIRQGEPPSVDRFLRDLFECLSRDGLALGHASNRGFGWFSIKWQTIVLS